MLDVPLAWRYPQNEVQRQARAAEGLPAVARPPPPPRSAPLFWKLPSIPHAGCLRPCRRRPVAVLPAPCSSLLTCRASGGPSPTARPERAACVSVSSLRLPGS